MKEKNSAIKFKKTSNRNLISFRSVTALALLSILFTLIVPINTIDRKKTIERRIRNAAKLQQISNNKVVYNYKAEKGVYCVANDFIKEKEHLFDTPKSMTISPYYIFPFKFEIINMLLEIPEISETVGKDQTLQIYLLVFQIMIYRYGPKNSIKNSFQKYNITDYEDYFEPDVALFESFPDFIASPVNYEKKILEIYKQNQGMFVTVNQVEKIYNQFYNKIQQKIEYKELLYSFVDQVRFKQTYSFVLNKATIVDLKEYYNLEGYTENDPKLSAALKKNNQFNKMFAKTGGVPTIINYLDICHHKQPKSINEANKNLHIVTAKKGFYSSFSPNNFKPGEEIFLTSLNQPTTLKLGLHFAYVLKKNIFDNIKITVKDDYIFTMDQIFLCKEIDCFRIEVRTPLQIKREREEFINNNQLNEVLLNYGRVRALEGKFDKKKLYKKYMKDKYFTKSNEISSYLFYLNVMKEQLRYDINCFLLAITEGTKIKKKIINSERDYDEDNLRKVTKYRTLKVMEMLYDINFLEKNVVIVHINKILDKIIEKSDDSIKNLKEKYLNKLNKK